MRTRQRTTNLTIGLFAVAAVLIVQLIVNAGGLEPSGPPGPTMKTIDQVEPRTPIPGSSAPEFPFVITESGSYYLTGNRAAKAHGIIVEVDNVTIDLMGHCLTGSGAGSNDGVHINEGLHNVTVRNGTINDFSNCGILAEPNNVGHSIIDIRASSNNGSGIYLGGTTHVIKGCGTGNNEDKGIYTEKSSRISDCTATSNGNDGISADEGSMIVNCVANNNDARGIDVDSSSVANCVANHNQTGGIRAPGSTVIGCCAYSNDGGSGIYGENSTIQACVARANTYTAGINAHYSTVVATTANENDGYGIQASYGSNITNCTADKNDSGGIQAGYGCRIESCNLYYNTGYGMWLNQDDTYAIKNSCKKDPAAIANFYNGGANYMPTDVADTDNANYAF
ncbi:MAG: right-handed parallel beta-helix repeat-containing protein [Sedimentisphaerales bacterium]|nr:right-handed parallel beta-helix repeat-containing protein [Sedimentisphaerales bacterium]